MKPCLTKFIAPTLGVLLLVAAGCETSFTEIKSPSVANVEVGQGTNKTTVKVSASRFNKHSQVGVRYLQVGDWKLAIEEFDQVIKASAYDEGALLGLAVANEQLGQLDKAFEYYKKANAAKAGGEPDPQVIAAIKRLEGKVKK
ncbi:MAG: hypothetical protein HY301_09145 [Verrucomicrobia bacterium]|nr:hypothetical protein [Verrucomicrobiota bacterium]